MKELIIKESRWLTGDDIDETKFDMDSCLYRLKDRKMCCLGFLGRKCGYKVEDIKDYGSPGDMLMYDIDHKSKWPKELVNEDENKDSIFCKKIIDINDSQKLTMADRKKKLIPLFKKLGYNLKFVK